MSAPDHAPDRLADLHAFLLELDELTERYGIELSDDETDGIIAYDQVEDTVLAHSIRFDDGEGRYHFSPYWNGRPDPTAAV